MSIMVYYTNILNVHEVEAITPGLDAVIGITGWTIDLSDSDKVLRVVAQFDVSAAVSDILRKHGFKFTLMSNDMP
jgi:hypothetical protein